MSRTPILRLAAVLLALVALRPALAGGPEKTDEAHNFRWTLPSDDWSFSDLPSDAQGAGYVAQAERRGEDAFVRITVRVVPTNGLPLDDLTRETQDGLRQQMEEVTGQRLTKGMLSGLEGTTVHMRGKAAGHDAGFRAITIEQGGKFHQMIFFLVGPADTRFAREIDAARRGYRLIRGAGPEEPPAPDDAGSVGGGEGVELQPSDGWPEQGPGREGNTLVFPHQNLRWTLPDGSPFAWRAPMKDESVVEGQRMLVGAVAAVPRVKEAQEGQVPENRAEVLLFAMPAEPGFTARRLVENEGLQNNLAENVFDRAFFERSKVVPEMDIGGVKGGALQMVGTKDKDVLYFRIYVAAVKGIRYQWEVRLRGESEVDDLFKSALNALIKGVEFVDTVEPVRGPLAIPGIPDHTETRGYGRGEEREITSVGFSIEKPAAFSQINYQPGEVPAGLRFAWEVRSDDGQSYLYVDLQTFTEQSLRDGNQEDEDLVRARVDEWKSNVQGATVTERRGEPFWKGRYGRGKGLEYELHGTLLDAPFVEHGYVVAYKKYVYWVRIQLGGKDAESAFARLVKDVEKSLKMLG